MSNMNRESNIIKINNILGLINNQLKLSFDENLSFFSNKDLFLILEFLQKGEFNIIGKILDIKMDEYKQLICELKRKNSLLNIQYEERSDIYVNQKYLEKLELELNY